MEFVTWIWNGMNTHIIVVVLTAFLTLQVGIQTFLRQQRIIRTQKIYFDETFLDLLNHLDNALTVTRKNLSLFSVAMNLIRDDMQEIRLLHPQQIEHVLSEILNKIEPISAYKSSKRERLITLFGNKYGYVCRQWLNKFDMDVSIFNDTLRERIVFLKNLLNESSIIDIMDRTANEIENAHWSLQRHDLLPYFVNKLADQISTFDFKARKNLIKKISSDDTIKKDLQDFDKVFKTLFVWFPQANNRFLSYLTDENNHRYIWDLNQGTIQIHQEQPTDMEASEIIPNDIPLQGLQVQTNGKFILFTLVQIGMANMCAFKQKPELYREAHSFKNGDIQT